MLTGYNVKIITMIKDSSPLIERKNLFLFINGFSLTLTQTGISQC